MEEIAVENIADGGLVFSVEKSFFQSPYYNIVNRLRKGVLKDHKIYLWGGAVRNPMIKVMLGKDIIPSDYDILVDDREKPLNISELLREDFDIEFNRFGNFKVKQSNAVLDVVPFSKKKLYIDGNHGEEPTLDKILRSSDFYMSALAFDFEKRLILSYGAYYDILDQKINILRVTDEPHVLLTRTVLYERKLGFKIAPEAKEFIASSFQPKMEENIRHYLEYKNLSQKHDYVMERLKEISRAEKRP